MRVRRDISSIPHRSASETWQAIVELVSSKDSTDAKQLSNAAGVMASIITDEHPSARPILLEGVGPQLRIYCQYGPKAIEAGSSLDPLSWNPTERDWTMHVPCDAENIEWVQKSFSETSSRIKVFDIAETDRAEDDASEGKVATNIEVNWNFGG